jgi:hypothetical protein
MTVAAGGGITASGVITAAGGFSATGLGYRTLAGGFVFWDGRTSMSSPVDGNLRLFNSAGLDFGRLQLGGTTSAFPSIKRNGTAINIRLADDSADAPLTCSNLTASGDIEVTDSASGIILKSPNGTRWRIIIDDSGELTTTAL